MVEGGFQGGARGLSERIPLGFRERFPLGFRERVPLDAWVLALGLLGWALIALLPSLHRGHLLSSGAFSLLPIAPSLLFFGWWLLRRRSVLLARGPARFDRAAPYVFLCGYPSALALSASRLDHDIALATFSPSVLLLSLLTLGGYLATASALCALPETVRSVDHRPLGEIPPVDSETRRQLVGKLVLATVASGALLQLSFCAWASPAHYREMWGRAAPEGATLTALTSGIVGALALSIVGPSLRAERGPKQSGRDRTSRVGWLLLVALSGLVVYAAIRSR